ncbi:sigma-70 family RNA polymerase sigma factor [Tepidicaulis sp. LMO-SS28]|uniref:RNA polymerase sigma factor n=1 Tax=Tepidicaulis sp. LMO-SS28 TaxID=3447455 RepID=UPI003EE1B68E
MVESARIATSVAESAEHRVSADLVEEIQTRRLVERMRSGDPAALEALYQVLAPRFYALCLRITRRQDLAEDALQESFLRMWRYASRYDPEKGSALGWMTAIVRNRARTAVMRFSKLKTVQMAEEVMENLPSEDSGGFEHLLENQAAKRLRHCLACLGVEARCAIMMSFFDGLTHVQIADRLGVPLGTAKSWVRRGLKQLRTCLSGVERLQLHDLLAAEHVLGLMPVKLDDVYIRMREADQKYCTAADWWQDQLSPMIYWLQPVRPPRSIWFSIDRQIKREGSNLILSWEWWWLPISIAGVLFLDLLL